MIHLNDQYRFHGSKLWFNNRGIWQKTSNPVMMVAYTLDISKAAAREALAALKEVALKEKAEGRPWVPPKRQTEETIEDFIRSVDLPQFRPKRGRPTTKKTVPASQGKEAFQRLCFYAKQWVDLGMKRPAVSVLLSDIAWDLHCLDGLPSKTIKMLKAGRI